MAMESGADTIMAMESGHAAHAAASSDTDGDCGHCPPVACEVVMSCDVEMSSECRADLQCTLDNRRVKLTLNDAQYDFPPDIAPAITDASSIDPDIVAPGIHVVAYAPGYQAPLNILNCVYLI